VVNRIRSNGQIAWGTDGVILRVTSPCDSFWQSGDIDPAGIGITTDFHGGVVVAWAECGPSWPDIYAQRVDSLGVIQWSAGGIPVCRDPSVQMAPKVISDGQGGALVLWRDTRTLQWNLFAQRVNENGEPLWQMDGVSVGANPLRKWDESMVSDGAGGAFVEWTDGRDGLNRRYVQRVSPSGAELWDSGDLLLSGQGVDYFPSMVSDGVRGAFHLWPRVSALSLPWDRRWDLFVQRSDGQGNRVWGNEGFRAVPGAYGGILCATDASDRVIVGWSQPGAADPDLYAQQLPVPPSLQYTGVELDATPPRIRIEIAPNPVMRSATIHIESPRPQKTRVAIFDLQGRTVRDFGTLDLPAGTRALAWDGRDDEARIVRSAIYVLRVDAVGSSSSARFALVR